MEFQFKHITALMSNLTSADFALFLMCFYGGSVFREELLKNKLNYTTIQNKLIIKLIKSDSKVFAATKDSVTLYFDSTHRSHSFSLRSV